MASNIDDEGCTGDISSDNEGFVRVVSAVLRRANHSSAQHTKEKSLLKLIKREIPLDIGGHNPKVVLEGQENTVIIPRCTNYVFLSEWKWTQRKVNNHKQRPFG